MASRSRSASSNGPPEIAPEDGAVERVKAKGKKGEKVDAVDQGILDKFAEWIVDEHRRRKERRSDREKIWREVDRQVAMRPIQRLDALGRDIGATDWMPEVELPLQAESLEVLCTDARRLMFDQEENWFRAHAAFDDDYRERMQGVLALSGDKVQWNQDAADKVTQAAINFFHRRYDFKARVDQLNAEAFKYGTFTFRALMLNEDRFQYEIGGVKAMSGSGPVLVPVSIKNVYLDDAPMLAAHEGQVVAPGFIRQYWQTLDDLKLAATLGSQGSEQGGWILSALKDLSPAVKGDHKGQIELLEFEGDFVHADGDETMFAPNVILTVAVSSSKRVVRVRGFDFPFRSYTVGHYQRDSIDDPYGSSPLEKGYGLQVATTEAMNRTLQAAVLNTEPPIRYDPNDWRLANAGGPRIEPRALWPAMSKPEPIIIGDPTALLAVYSGLLKQYQDQTGVNDPRMGAQTVSHVTAYAVGAQQNRGQVRTVDYAQSTLAGPMMSWLYKSFEMAKISLGKEPQQVFIDQYKGFVKITADFLPDIVVFDAIGASNPQEEAQENQMFMQIASALIKIEPVMRQLGGTPLDVDALRKEGLRRGGVTDVETYFQHPPEAAAAGPAGPVAPPGGVPIVNPGAPAFPGTSEALNADSVAALAAAVSNSTAGAGG